MPFDQLVLREDLGIQLLEDAAQSDTSIDQLLNQAVEEFLLNKQREKIDAEIAAYIELHPELWKTRAGQWVAVHDGQVVDADPDRVALYQRVRQRFGKTPVLIREVAADPDPEIWIRTPSTGKLEQ